MRPKKTARAARNSTSFDLSMHVVGVEAKVVEVNWTEAGV